MNIQPHIYRKVTGGVLCLLSFLFLYGCATPTKTIVLRNMPSTLVINRGIDVSEKQCASVISPGEQTWGCSSLYKSKDKCEISLDYFRGVGVTVHELAHCSGYDEKEARDLTLPELE